MMSTEAIDSEAPDFLWPWRELGAVHATKGIEPLFWREDDSIPAVAYFAAYDAWITTASAASASEYQR